MEEAGRNAIDRDVAACKLLRQRLGHADQARLRRRIIRLTGVAGDAHDRGDGDDAAVPRLHHRLGGGADQAERGFQIDADTLIPLLVLHPPRQIVERYPSVIYVDVEHATPRLDRARSEEQPSELQSLMRNSYAV